MTDKFRIMYKICYENHLSTVDLKINIYIYIGAKEEKKISSTVVGTTQICEDWDVKKLLRTCGGAMYRLMYTYHFMDKQNIQFKKDKHIDKAKTYKFTKSSMLGKPYDKFELVCECLTTWPLYLKSEVKSRGKITAFSRWSKEGELKEKVHAPIFTGDPYAKRRGHGFNLGSINFGGTAGSAGTSPWLISSYTK